MLQSKTAIKALGTMARFSAIMALKRIVGFAG